MADEQEHICNDSLEVQSVILLHEEICRLFDEPRVVERRGTVDQDWLLYRAWASLFGVYVKEKTFILVYKGHVEGGR